MHRWEDFENHTSRKEAPARRLEFPPHWRIGRVKRYSDIPRRLMISEECRFRRLKVKVHPTTKWGWSGQSRQGVLEEPLGCINLVAILAKRLCLFESIFTTRSEALFDLFSL